MGIKAGRAQARVRAFNARGVTVVTDIEMGMICVDCEKSWPADRFNAGCGSPRSCFRCRSSSISMGVQGEGNYFTEFTDKERRDRTWAEARANGMEPVPSNPAGVSVSAYALKTIAGASKSAGAFGFKGSNVAKSEATTASKVA